MLKLANVGRNLIEKAQACDEVWIKALFRECKSELGSFDLWNWWGDYLAGNSTNCVVISNKAFLRWSYSRKYQMNVVHDIATLKVYRCKGYALTLLKSVPTPFMLKCNQDNDGGNKFYKSIGMRKEGVTATKQGRQQNIWVCVGW